MPFPAKLSKASHTACITNTNNTTKKVAVRGIRKLFKMYLSSIFNTENSNYKATQNRM